MTAKERLNKLLSETPPDQIDSSLFWREQLERAFGSTDAHNQEDQRYLEGLIFLYRSSVIFEELTPVFENHIVLTMFREHLEMTNALWWDRGIKFKVKIEK